MTAPRELSRDTTRGLLISKTPDICRSPVCPVPYTIVARQADDANTAPTVRFTGERAHKQTSIITVCSGDEPGTGLGIKSGTVKSICHRKTHSSRVRVEGQWATRHLDEWWMNNRNTFGLLYFIEDQKLYDPAPVIDWKLSGEPMQAPVDGGDVESPNMVSLSALPTQMTASMEDAPERTVQMTAGVNPEDAWMRGQQFGQRVMRAPPRPVYRSPQHQPYSPRNRPFERHRYAPNHYNPSNTTPGAWRPTDFFNHPSVRYQPSGYLYSNPRWTVPPGGAGRIPAGDIELLPPPDGEPVFGVEPVYRASNGQTFTEDEIQREWNSVCRIEPVPLALPGYNSVLDRITRRRRDRNCRLRPYKEGCGDAGIYTTPHHVTPDRVFRHPGSSTLYPGGVSHGDGLSICVQGGTPTKHGPNANEHGLIHLLVDAGEKRIGESATPTGVAPLRQLEENGIAGAAAVTGCDPEAMRMQVRAYHQARGLGPDTPFRADPSGTIKPDPALLGTRTRPGLGGL